MTSYGRHVTKNEICFIELYPSAEYLSNDIWFVGAISSRLAVRGRKSRIRYRACFRSMPCFVNIKIECARHATQNYIFIIALCPPREYLSNGIWFVGVFCNGSSWNKYFSILTGTEAWNVRRELRTFGLKMSVKCGIFKMRTKKLQVYRHPGCSLGGEQFSRKLDRLRIKK